MSKELSNEVLALAKQVGDLVKANAKLRKSAEGAVRTTSSSYPNGAVIGIKSYTVPEIVSNQATDYLAFSGMMKADGSQSPVIVSQNGLFKNQVGRALTGDKVLTSEEAQKAIEAKDKTKAKIVAFSDREPVSTWKSGRDKCRVAEGCLFIPTVPLRITVTRRPAWVFGWSEVGADGKTVVYSVCREVAFYSVEEGESDDTLFELPH